MDASGSRDVALVLSGGGVNGVLLELGFLRRLRESPSWSRIGWIYGTSAGALSGSMAALDQLDELEEFLLELQPSDVFRPRRVWQFPGGLHDYTLPGTIAERIGSPLELGLALASSPIELVVFATDVSDTAIEHARAGIYPASVAADVGADRLRRFFTRSDGNYRVSKLIRDLCVFARQDLTKDPPFSRIDLVMCRNVLIYMDAVLQKKLIALFHYALDGLLLDRLTAPIDPETSTDEIVDALVEGLLPRG